MNLSHLEKLESESLHIIREVASEFENPVMLYSIGKDSAVMLHLALKAFSPGKLMENLVPRGGAATVVKICSSGLM